MRCLLHACVGFGLALACWSACSAAETDAEKIERDRALAAIKGWGGSIATKGEARTVVSVTLSDTKVTDADLAQLSVFPDLDYLSLSGTWNWTARM